MARRADFLTAGTGADIKSRIESNVEKLVESRLKEMKNLDDILDLKPDSRLNGVQINHIQDKTLLILSDPRQDMLDLGNIKKRLIAYNREVYLSPQDIDWLSKKIALRKAELIVLAENYSDGIPEGKQDNLAQKLYEKQAEREKEKEVALEIQDSELERIVNTPIDDIYYPEIERSVTGEIYNAADKPLPKYVPKTEPSIVKPKVEVKKEEKAYPQENMALAFEGVNSISEYVDLAYKFSDQGKYKRENVAQLEKTIRKARSSKESTEAFIAKINKDLEKLGESKSQTKRINQKLVQLLSTDLLKWDKVQLNKYEFIDKWNDMPDVVRLISVASGDDSIKLSLKKMHDIAENFYLHNDQRSWKDKLFRRNRPPSKDDFERDWSKFMDGLINNIPNVENKEILAPAFPQKT